VKSRAEEDMARTRAADGFATIRVRMEELRRERERRQPAEGDLEVSSLVSVML
jgi:hypothetical protein